MKAIRNIVVPTDFSVTARNAFEYAQVLATAFKAEIRVVHVHESYHPVTTLPVTSLSDSERERLTDAMNNFLDEQSDKTTVTTAVKTQILRGSTVDALTELSRDNDCDLIVMGTTGLQDFLSKIIGSTSLEVANKAHCPVVLVPRDAHWHPIERIAFATDYDSAVPRLIRVVSDLAKTFGAAIDFVHVNQNPTEDDAVLETIWSTLFEGTDPRIAFQIHALEDINVVRALRRHVVKNAVDMLIVATRHRTFWQNLMHRSITENVAISVERPIWVMHLDEATEI